MAEMDKKTVRFINICLIILLVIFLGIEYNWMKKRSVKTPPPPVRGAVKNEPVKYRAVPGRRTGPKSDFEKMFANNTRKDVGDNIVEAWRNVPPEAAREAGSKLSRDIKRLEVEVRRDPENKKARQKLKVAKILKGLVDNGFDINNASAKPKKTE